MVVPTSYCPVVHVVVGPRSTAKLGTSAARPGHLLRSVVVTPFQTVMCHRRVICGSQHRYSMMCVGRAAASL